MSIKRASMVIICVSSANNYCPCSLDRMQVVEAVVDSSRLVMRLSGKFSTKEASSGDLVTLSVGLLSLLPVELNLEALEVRIWLSGAVDGSSFCVAVNRVGRLSADGTLSAGNSICFGRFLRIF